MEMADRHPDHANFWDEVKAGAELLIQIQPEIDRDTKIVEDK